ncbi:diguanylate cyclase [Clostridium pasteurianum DSM 525 = ATCC 6013]|uniref:Diguanylate cyclase n=1 Tax=Clostridium pasteurianum DSM 525 = ATCC 6013 TaxID=1262449 RepID=A0A0H3J3I3_CLOPA|nr:sensor domain-containing diguanylate cyclase [Clostridium pasteurianum]AJA47377.1 diguanylate cyclase [Clostridium pasteurianum DSM 525 = ATCC 6013]AJA51365.1 diguanylate cyclase [Clostridium pasteurianum DSM 525 = ATCC 6013]AOZ74707.1 histidine kinase [Clostridium pasteurianum DSM 525 = ATCC 6013]AOZ78503.1 histidine kinase [Clostridium pasteurianum]ELP58713.1 Signal transduction protein containing diguanilate cyclase/phosphodiesterase domain (GGDEF) [Clostridium pasteurianum DSM 525 = ATC
MDRKDDIQSEFLKLKEEFETYQNFAESTIQMMNEKNTQLEKKLDSLTNIIEISKYINSNISADNLITMINDMIIGILGVTYSSICLIDKNTNHLIVKATNIKSNKLNFEEDEFFKNLNNEQPFVLNCKDPMLLGCDTKVNIHSIIGVPIYLRNEFRGYIIVEHTLLNFFSHDHITFISSIANQIAIALENNFLYNQIKEASIKDPLMGIYNRRYFFEFLEKKVLENSREEFAIVMMDIDNFKKFNDTYGHQFGDKALISIGEILKDGLEENDCVARYGGEEIVIYINKAYNHQLVFNRIEEIRKKICGNVVEYDGNRKSISASFGISYYPQNGDTVQKVLSVADAMLYEAKNLGRNRVITV